MIRLHVTRIDDASGVETELGELRLAELGARPAVYRETADGHAVMPELRTALAWLAPDTAEGAQFVRAASRLVQCRGCAGKFLPEGARFHECLAVDPAHNWQDNFDRRSR